MGQGLDREEYKALLLGDFECKAWEAREAVATPAAVWKGRYETWRLADETRNEDNVGPGNGQAERSGACLADSSKIPR